MKISRLGRPGRAVVALAVVSVMALAGLMIPVHADTAGDLAAAKAKLQRLVNQINDEQKQVAALEHQASVLAGKVSDVESRLANTQQAIIKVQAAIQTAQAALDRQQDQLNERARIAYENGPGSSLEFLLSSTSVADLTDRLEIVNSIAEHDQAIINSIQNQEASLEIKRAELSDLEAKLVADRAELATQQEALLQKLDQAKQILGSVEQDKKEVQSLVTELGNKLEEERAAAAAAALAAQSGSGGGAAIKGVFFVCPVDQPHGYSDDFGAPRYGGGYHLHAGNDIFAPRGTPIRAPFAGTAANASNDLGGLSVYVTGALGYVYNAHLSSIGTLGSVSAGTIVGYVGDSGDAQGGATHDHFEWHPNAIPSNPHVSPYGQSVIGGAIDPYPYLNSVC